MYKTKLDRWLMETFVYEHHIKVVHLPEKLPMGIKVSEIKARQYHYLLVAKNRHKAEKLIDLLNDTGSVYSTRIIEGSHWYNGILLNKSKSVTFTLIWWGLVLGLAFYLYTIARSFMQTDAYFKLQDEILELLKIAQ